MMTIQLEELSKEQKEIIIKASHRPSTLSKVSESDMALLKSHNLVNSKIDNNAKKVYSLSEKGIQYARILKDKKKEKRENIFFKWITLVISLVALILSIINTYNDLKIKEPNSLECTTIIKS